MAATQIVIEFCEQNESLEPYCPFDVVSIESDVQ